MAGPDGYHLADELIAKLTLKLTIENYLVIRLLSALCRMSSPKCKMLLYEVF